MDLVTGCPYWPLRDGLPFSYRSLDQDVRCQVAIVGAGITGALSAYALAKEGVDVVVVDERDVGTGSTAASTCLIQYEIDTPLVELADEIGLDAARRAYLASHRSVEELGAIVKQLGENCAFSPMQSLYAASRKKDFETLREEEAARRTIGIDAALLTADQVAEQFGMGSHGALLSSRAGVVDAYRLTHLLLHASGARVFSRTSVGIVKPVRRNVTLTTSEGFHVRAERVLFATGYETQRYLKSSRVTLKTTYATISEPQTIEAEGDRRSRFILWETARPYFYARPAPEGRMLIGGLDDPFTRAKRRSAALPSKVRSLVRKYEKVFPRAGGPRFKPAYSWAGVFGESDDGLPFIGTCDNGGMKHAYYAVGYGGNGITFSVIAAGLIRDAFLKRDNPDAGLFCFER